MPDYKLIRADEITVYDSTRKPITVKRDGVITTTDPGLMRNLASDTRFALVPVVPVETKVGKVEEPARRGRHRLTLTDDDDDKEETPVENFVTEVPKK